MRHAKSDWGNPGLQDWERPLNARGRRDAPRMAGHLLTLLPKIDRIHPSTALRTRQTGMFLKEVYELPDSEFIPAEALYLGYPEAYLHQIWSLEEEIDNVVLIGHNPTMTHIANQIQYGLTDNVPTCGVIWVQAELKDWADFDFDKARLKAYFYPKMLKR